MGVFSQAAVTERRNRASLDRRDVQDDLTADQQLILALRFCVTSRAYFRGLKALITWAPDAKSFTCEHSNEQVARWAGFNALQGQEDFEERRIALVWLGTGRTSSGTYAAQFDVVEAE